MGLIQWRSLKIPSRELRLEFTLQTGQSFRWYQTAKEVYTGVIGTRVFQLRHEPDLLLYRRLNKLKETVQEEIPDEQILKEYFNFDELRMEDSVKMWIQKDARFASIAPFLTGARVLKQDPLECLFQFICSSNNNITRIQKMVSILCQSYGDLLWPMKKPLDPLEESQSNVKDDLLPSSVYHAFPSLDQMKRVNEEELRNHGFGYRAKYVANCVQALLEMEQGGHEWLQSLRSTSYEEAVTQLCKLPGVGPKVASCICLFSLNKHNAIPVDTHVHQLAIKYYQPELKGKSLTKKIMKEIEAKFQDVFGDHAGWAHNVLFLGELLSHQKYLPEELRQTKSINIATRNKRKCS
eukprot:g4631.t1